MLDTDQSEVKRNVPSSVRMSAELGWDTIPEQWKDGEPKEPTGVRYIQRYSPAIFAYQLTEEVKRSGADVLFDCMAVDPVMEGNLCRGVLTESKAGTEFYGCRMLIDTTGDCDVLRRGGVDAAVEHSEGEDELVVTVRIKR